MRSLSAVLLLLLVGACELKENAPPPQAETASAPIPVDTVYQTDTVTLTQVETVFVVDTVYDTVTVAAQPSRATTKSATKAGTKSTTKAAEKTPPTVVKKPIAVTKAPVDTRSLPATSAAKSTTVKATTAVTSAVSSRDLDYLRSRRLLIPVAGIPLAKVPDNFLEKRGSRQHSALDFMAARGTPVVSADAGAVEKIHTSAGGGLTLYLSDPSGEFIYYYAHLDRYKPGIKEGDRIAAGEIIGYVGSTGNAVASAPHLHFAIGKMDAEKRWWKTTAIDPKPLLTRPAPAR